MDKTHIYPKKIYERKTNFYLCDRNHPVNETTTYLADIIDLEMIKYSFWSWVLLVLNLIQLGLYVLQAKGKINLFGGIVTVKDMLDGPKPPEECECSESDENAGISVISHDSVDFYDTSEIDLPDQNSLNEVQGDLNL